MNDAKRALSEPDNSEVFLVRFAGGKFPGDAQWVGETWPLPDEIWVAKGHMTGIISHVVPTEQDAFTLAALEEVADVEKYHKVSESQLPEPASHVMRGAQYEPRS